MNNESLTVLVMAILLAGPLIGAALGYTRGQAVAGFFLGILQFWGWIAVVWLLPNRKKERADAELKARHEEQVRLHALESVQRKTRATLESLADRIQRGNTSLSQFVHNAEAGLDRAAYEFAERAFAPFWSEVEKAALHLERFDSTINDINRNIREFRKLLPVLESKFLTTPEVGTVPDTTRLAARMKSMVRDAQKDFQFAAIYEQRQTNRLLHSGFANLGELLAQVGDRVEASLTTLNVELADLASSTLQQQSDIAERMKEMRDDAATDSQERRKHEAQELEMLDNIQRSRKPRHVYPEKFD